MDPQRERQTTWQRQLEGDGVEWQQSEPARQRGGSNPIESSEPSISDPSRRVKGRGEEKKEEGASAASAASKEGKNQCSIHPQATPDMDPPPPFARAGHIWHATVLQSRRRRTNTKRLSPFFLCKRDLPVCASRRWGHKTFRSTANKRN